jgi:tetratricopeptide (TPR) repeat protein
MEFKNARRDIKNEFDVFLCHNSSDKSEVKKIGSKLIDLGIIPWLDEWNLRPGFPWQKELENQIESIKSVAVFVGPNNLGPWQDQEIDAFLRQFTKRKCPVIPVILPKCKNVPKLPIFLEGFTWVDFRLEDPDPLGRLVWGITGKKDYLLINTATNENKSTSNNNDQKSTSIITNIYGPVYGQVHSGTGNIVLVDKKISNSNGKTFKDSTKNDNYHQVQLGQEYEDKLIDLNNQRLIGDIDGAWTNLRKYLEDLTVRDIPRKIAARYYYQAALWALVDYPEKKESDRYYKLALNLNKDLDTRTYKARMLLLRKQAEEALEILKPYDKENVLVMVLQILIEERRGEEANKYISNCNLTTTHGIRHMMSLCYIQDKQYKDAKKEISKAIAEVPNSPIYHMVAGISEYWQGLPDEIENNKDIKPIFLNTNIFSPTMEQKEHLEEALRCFEQAKKLASFYNNEHILSEINQAWYLTAYLLPGRKEEANKIVLETIKNKPTDTVAVLFAIENNLPIEDSVMAVIKNFVDRGTFDLNHIVVLASLLIKNKNSKEAVLLLEKHKAEFFNQNIYETWFQIMIDAYVLINEFDNAEKLLDSTENIGIDLKDRLKCLIYEKQGKVSELRILINNLFKRTNSRIDLWNLILFYRQEQEWLDVITYSEIMINKYNDLHFIEILAEAQLKINKPNDCIITLSNSNLSVNAKTIKLNAYISVGKLDEALSIANELWDIVPNENLLLQIARLYFFIGDKSSSISVLRNGIINGYTSSGILLMLADLIKNSNPNEAFDFAKKAVDGMNDNPQVLLAAINIGYHTGYDYEASQLLAKFQMQYPNSELLKAIPTTEMIPMIQKWSEASNQNTEYFMEGLIPLHILLDSENSSMGLDFYWRWNHNKNVDFPFKIPFPLSFGGHSLLDLNLIEPKVVFMDYSACLVAHALNLFEFLKRGFSQIVVSPYLFGLIGMEIDKISEAQISRVQIRKKLLSSISNLKINYVSVQNIPNINEFDIEDSDYREYITAKENEALIVGDSFSTEILKGRTIPNEIASLQVYTAEILKALVDMGEISVNTIERFIHGREVRNEVVEKILSTPNCKILVDVVFMETIQELECLDIICERFSLIMFDNAFDYIKHEQNAYEKREEASSWLSRLLDILNNLKMEQKLSFGSISSENDDFKISGIIFDMLNYGQENEVAIWCDDRNISSYTSCGKSVIIGVFDIIEWLLENGLMSDDIYRAKINTLFLAGVQFHVPSVKHLTMCLALTDVNRNNEQLIENNRLKIIRQYISAALASNTIIGTKKLGHVNLPESGGYLWNLHKLLDESLIYVWTIPNKEEIWRRAASTWLILFCSDFIGDITHLTNNNAQIDEFTSIKQSFFLSLGFRISMTMFNDTEIPKGYFNWLYSWLNKHWEYNPDTKDKTLEMFVNTLIRILTKDVDQEIVKLGRNTFLYIFKIFIDNLSEEIKQWVINHKDINEILGNEYKKIVLIDGFPKGILKETWHNWVSNAISRGSGLKGVENYKGSRLTTVFYEGSLVSQYVQVKWTDETKKKYIINVYEPYGQLHHSDANIRSSWFDLAYSYIGTNPEIEKCKEEILKRNRKAVVEYLEDILLKSPHFFYEKLKLEIQNNLTDLPKADVLFPHMPDTFENQLSIIPDQTDITGEAWYEYCYSQLSKNDMNVTFNIISSLPLGRVWGFPQIVNNLVKESIIELKDAITWCLNVLINADNPIKQQNILSFLLQYQDQLSQENLESISFIFNALFDEITDGKSDIVDHHRLFISILKMAWRYMESINEYKCIDVDKKILWAYIYTDNILQIYLEQIKQKLVPYDTIGVREAIDSVANKLLTEMHPLRVRIGYPIEVTNPECSSIWRNIYGGTLGVIKGSKTINNHIKDNLRLIFSSIEEKILTQEIFKIDGGDEYLLNFNFATNRYCSYFNENNIQRMQEIQENWGDVIDKRFEPTELFKIILDTLLKRDTFDEYVLSHLIILAKQPFPNGLLNLVKLVIEKYRLCNDLSDKELLIRGKMLSIIIKSFVGNDIEYYRDIYISDLKEILVRTPSRWQEIIEVLLSLYSSYDYKKSAEDFIKAIEVLLEKQEIKITPEFVDFINELPWWMPVNLLDRIHKVRRSVNTRV